MKIYVIYSEWYYEDSYDHTEGVCEFDEAEMHIFKRKRDALEYIEKSINWDLRNKKVITSKTNTQYVAQCLIQGTPYRKITRLIEKELI